MGRRRGKFMGRRSRSIQGNGDVRVCVQWSARTSRRGAIRERGAKLPSRSDAHSPTASSTPPLVAPPHHSRIAGATAHRSRDDSAASASFAVNALYLLNRYASLRKKPSRARSRSENPKAVGPSRVLP
jgi:hypothetical protein